MSGPAASANACHARRAARSQSSTTCRDAESPESAAGLRAAALSRSLGVAGVTTMPGRVSASARAITRAVGVSVPPNAKRGGGGTVDGTVPRGLEGSKVPLCEQADRQQAGARN